MEFATTKPLRGAAAHTLKSPQQHDNAAAQLVMPVQCMCPHSHQQPPTSTTPPLDDHAATSSDAPVCVCLRDTKARNIEPVDVGLAGTEDLPQLERIRAATERQGQKQRRQGHHR